MSNISIYELEDIIIEHFKIAEEEIKNKVRSAIMEVGDIAEKEVTRKSPSRSKSAKSYKYGWITNATKELIKRLHEEFGGNIS